VINHHLKEPSQHSCGVIVAVDVDNLIISAAGAGQKIKGYSLMAGFENMFAWISQAVGQILCVHFFMPQTQCLVNEDIWNELWQKYKSQFFIGMVFCPKVRDFEGRKKDNVDAQLIEHTKKMMELFGQRVKCLVLGSGDCDYSRFVWDLGREGIKTAFIIGGEMSFAKLYRSTEAVAKNSETGKELVHCFVPQKNN